MNGHELPPFDESEKPPMSPELFPTTALIDYLRGQFEDAYNKESDETNRGSLAQHGSFYQWVSELDGNELTRDTVRIVMKLPHPYDRPGDYTEVFAVFLRGEDGHETGDTSGFFADQFLVRGHEAGTPKEWWVVTDDGVYQADIEQFDLVTGYERAESDDPFEPYERAKRLLEALEARNIVASAE